MKLELLADTAQTHAVFRQGRRRLGAWAALAGFILGCDESGPRVYTAQRHSVEAGCLEAYVPIGLVEAAALSALCAPACLSLGEDVYVSALCPPYPAEASLEAEGSEACAAALAAATCDELLETPDAAAP